jgi:nitroimidazol reductase NimA-like FMN-containing flavoprotein (pyridoxamine 5'-phosphate oxidase superfamily)
MLSKTPRTQLNKAAHKGTTDLAQLHSIIDESLIAHIAITEATGPVVIPMLAWRVEDFVYIHGANNSRLMRGLKTGQPTCLTFTIFDGWILARSAFHHSAHYRSAVVFGQFEAVAENAEKDRLLNHLLDQIAHGRSEEVRKSNERELSATMVLKIPLTEASVKISNAEVNDDAADLSLPIWAGYLPYKTVVGPLKPARDVDTQLSIPDYSLGYGERWQQP